MESSGAGQAEAFTGGGLKEVLFERIDDLQMFDPTVVLEVFRIENFGTRAERCGDD